MTQTEFDNCHAQIRMTAAEYRYVEEIPGVEMWWEGILWDADHPASQCPRPNPNEHERKCCTPPADKRTVQCALSSRHDGEHAALVATSTGESLNEPYLYWTAGLPGAREIRQPGNCHLGDTGESSMCHLPAGHPGQCRIA